MTVLPSSQMALVDITKQIAVQALGDALDTSPAKTAAPESVAAAIVGQVQAMQKALKEDEELVVLCHAGADTVRVMQFIVPSPQVMVLAGVDGARNTARVVSAPEAVQLVCKVAKVQPNAKPARITFLTPKRKSD